MQRVPLGCLLCAGAVLEKGAPVVAKETSVLLLMDTKPHSASLLYSVTHPESTRAHSVTQVYVWARAHTHLPSSPGH